MSRNAVRGSYTVKPRKTRPPKTRRMDQFSKDSTPEKNFEVVQKNPIVFCRTLFGKTII